MMNDWTALLELGAVLPIDAIPILKLIPERWAKWKLECKWISNLQHARYFGLVEETRERMRQNQHNGSFMEDILECQSELGMDDEMTGSLCWPCESQKKAHEEIDRVVGEDRMPTLEDLGQMPYIRAIISETHRWRPIAPLGLPHRALAPEEYQGYLIPKGTTIFVNMWGIFHDPVLYDNPEDFVLERYPLSENGTKPGVDGSHLKPTFSFGFGRNLNAMNLLWAFDFKPDIGINGHPILVDIFACRKALPRHQYVSSAASPLVRQQKPESLECLRWSHPAPPDGSSGMRCRVATSVVDCTVRVEFKWAILTTILATILEFFYRGRNVIMQNRPPESV
ncbi:cytochrome P450 [Mycena albidolilacea]|uniref:Cytochrome P450 n=1 Tax=Mycena albidolilacea TaxID=1033008 RepID=A0AAD6Z3L0_9AGAR|nr:cytochrome P450 [Mycena albidolilacea]